MTQILDVLLLSHKSLRLIIFFSLISLCSLDWVISIDLSSGSLIHYHYSVIIFLLLISFSEFVVSVTVFLFLKFPVSSSLYFCFFAKTFYWEVCFKCVYNCSLKCFMMLYNPCQIIPQLISLYWCLFIVFSHSSWDFLGSWNDEWF